MNNFVVLTNHKHLQGVFSKALFDLASPRLQHLLEKVAAFSFQVKWVLGKSHYIANVLSHARNDGFGHR